MHYLALVLEPRLRYKALVLGIETRYFVTRYLSDNTVNKASSTAQPPASRPRPLARRALQYFLLIVGVVLMIDALVGDKGLLAMLQARARHAALEQSLAQVRTDNAWLREEGRRLREDPDAIEELARRDLGLIKPGEQLFIVKDVAPRDPR